MQIKKIGRARGELCVPGDKSISHRGVMLGAIAGGVSEISGFLNGADCLSTISCFQKMGVNIERSGENVKVFGNGLSGLKAPAETLYTGNSGTTTRLLAGLLAGQKFDSVIEGDASIVKRPMGRVVKPLTLMGASIDGEFCPLKIQGRPLHGIEYNTGVASAQVKTAIALAGLYAEGETVIHEPALSRNHTELMLRAMGANIETNDCTVKISHTDRLEPQKFEVPGDISSAAFFIVLAAILPKSEITVKNVGINPTRSGILDVMERMGAQIKLENKRIAAGEDVCDIVVGSSELKGTVIEGNIIPRLIDELPVIAAAAAVAEGRTEIRDAAELKVKETNRIAAVVTELLRCGVDITETDDGMIINGGKPITGAAFKSYNDHRMAMSMAILAQTADGDSSIDDENCVSISYPNFFDDLYKLGK